MRNSLDIQDVCKKLRPLFGNKVDELFLEYSMADTMAKKSEIYQVLIALYSRYVDDKLLEYNIKHDLSPGDEKYKDPIILRRLVQLRHNLFQRMQIIINTNHAHCQIIINSSGSA